VDKAQVDISAASTRHGKLGEDKERPSEGGLKAPIYPQRRPRFLFTSQQDRSKKKSPRLLKRGPACTADLFFERVVGIRDDFYELADTLEGQESEQ
jgi:hypothetical protein